MRNFPGNHQPDVRDRYADLTAMFDAGKAMPTRGQQVDALTAFVLKTGPATELPALERDKPFRGAPEVGARAPGFSLTDIAGRKWSLAQLTDKRALVLVFSRAHW
ncbi:MAG: hypothetical protein HZA91_04180 [Verrucomicrobia bacterium]|nr:hypothetical protein [Verrucomicrobiota bacterium]